MANKSTTIKFKKDKNSWEQIYGNEINNRLRKDKNLSDVNNKAESRKNLELVGDNNTTHFHDSRYVPMIENEKNERKTETTQLRTDLNAETANRTKDKEDISKTLVKVQNNINTTVADTKKELSNNMNTLQNNVDIKINQVNQKLDKVDVGKKTMTTAGSLHSESATLNQSRLVDTQTQYIDKDHPPVKPGWNCRDIVIHPDIPRGGTRYIYENSHVEKNIVGGTYTVEQLLDKLAAASHVHTVTECTSSISECDCNCYHMSNSH